MKLNKFVEYASNNVDQIVSFNKNEIKYLKDKGNLYRDEDYGYYVNGRYVQKLYSGEYYVESDKVKCNTIQSLLKYTKDSSKEVIELFGKYLSNSTCKEYEPNVILWYYNNTDDFWAIQDIKSNRFIVNGNFFAPKYYNQELELIYHPLLNKQKDFKKYRLVVAHNLNNILQVLYNKMDFNSNESMYIKNESLETNQWLPDITEAYLKLISNYIKDSYKASIGGFKLSDTPICYLYSIENILNNNVAIPKNIFNFVNYSSVYLKFSETDDENLLGEFYPKTSKILLFFTKEINDDILELLKTNSDIYSKMYFKFYSDLLHEIIHAYNDYRSKGKVNATLPSSSNLDSENDIIEYLNNPDEVAARFGESLNKVLMLDINDDFWNDENFNDDYYHNPINWKKKSWIKVLRDFKSVLGNWNYYTKDNQKRMIKKLAKAYAYKEYKKKEPLVIHEKNKTNMSKIKTFTEYIIENNNTSKLSVGTKVIHKKYGNGVVIKDRAGDTEKGEVLVRFEKHIGKRSNFPNERGKTGWGDEDMAKVEIVKIEDLDY